MTSKTNQKKRTHSLKNKTKYSLKNPPLIINLLRKHAVFEILSLLYSEGKPMRFKKIEDSLPEISNSTITFRLSYLCNESILERISYNESPPRVDYALTKKGNAIMLSLFDLIKKHE